MCEERARLEAQATALKYERRIQELELGGCVGGGERSQLLLQSSGSMHEAGLLALCREAAHLRPPPSRPQPNAGGSSLLGCASPTPSGRGAVLEYIPRAEHLRILEARLAAKEGDAQLELSGRVAQAEREWQWKLEGREQEVAGLTARVRQVRACANKVCYLLGPPLSLHPAPAAEPPS